jgi:hypothetical protein
LYEYYSAKALLAAIGELERECYARRRTGWFEGKMNANSPQSR